MCLSEMRPMPKRNFFQSQSLIPLCCCDLPQYLSVRGCWRKRCQKPQQTQPRSVYLCHISAGKRRNTSHLGGTPGRRRLPWGEWKSWHECWTQRGLTTEWPTCRAYFPAWLKSDSYHPVPEKFTYTKNMSGRVVCDWRQPQVWERCRTSRWRRRRRGRSHLHF